MFTWTFNKLLVLFVCVLPFGGCMAPDGEGTSFSFLNQPDGTGERDAEAVRRVSLFGGRVVVAGPEGYCIDMTSLRRGGNGAVVLIASCESLTGRVGRVVDPAVITVSVLPRRPGAMAPSTRDLAASIEDAQVIASEDGDGISLIQLASGGDAVLPDGDPRYWRGGMLINGHLVGLAVYAPRAGRASGAQGRVLLLDMAETLRELSPVRDYTPDDAVTQAATGSITGKAVGSAIGKKATGLGPLRDELFPESN